MQSTTAPPIPLQPATPTFPPSFPHHLPKIELHAHLTGSIRPATLHTLWSALPHPPPSLPDPLAVLTPTTRFDIKTFFPLFSTYIYKLINTKASLITTTHAVLTDFRADGVVYLELRTTPRDLGTGEGKDGYVRTVLDCIAEFSSASEEEQERNPMQTYLILSIDRRNTVAEAMEVVDLAIKYRDRGVVGLDLCGNPHAAPGDEVRRFAGAFARAKEAGLGVTVHFAEVEKDDGGEELRALLDFRPDRVGHVCHPGEGIRQEVLDRGLGVELCVSCNVMAGLTEGKDDLMRLARKPIECIFGPEKERQRLYEIFREFETT
ncbi:MAG: hypothetical protein OHK93_001254 [Ramalina farinacea]|uniref:Adenosine deaminase domain-containing protein n=1 Tax=Ramalina farinacea TaxID=258253 RepID=A0AA43QTH6_9LECA|nr:hypothetical protein [Ramalina farinacea]